MWSPRRKPETLEQPIWLENHAQDILILLYLQNSWSLETKTQVPELDPAPNTGHSRLPSTATQDVWVARWEERWSAVWSRFDSTEESQPETGRSSPDPNDQNQTSWFTVYGTDGIDVESFQQWEAEVLTKNGAINPRNSMPISLLPLLNEASMRGITRIIELPYRGHFSQRLSNSCLAISTLTLRDKNDFKGAIDLL